MAIISTVAAVDSATGGSVRDRITSGVKNLFGGGSNFAQQNRNRKREALRKVGFNWRKTSGVPAGEQWNIDNWSDKALDNIARLYDRYGETAVNLHNEKKISDSRVAENFETIEQMALSRQEKNSGSGSSGYFSGRDSDGQSAAMQAGSGVVTAVIIAGGLFWLISKG